MALQDRPIIQYQFKPVTKKLYCAQTMTTDYFFTLTVLERFTVDIFTDYFAIGYFHDLCHILHLVTAHVLTWLCNRFQLKWTADLCVTEWERYIYYYYYIYYGMGAGGDLTSLTFTRYILQTWTMHSVFQGTTKRQGQDTNFYCGLLSNTVQRSGIPEKNHRWAFVHATPSRNASRITLM